MAISTYLADALLDHITGEAAYTAPTTINVHLYTSDPGVDDSGNEVSDTVDDTAYAEQAVTFAAAATREAASDSTVTFPAVVYGSGGAAFDVTHVALKDQAGNLLVYEALATAKEQVAGDVFQYDAGDLIMKITS